MPEDEVPEFPLTIPRGAVWRAHAWVLLDRFTGEALREIPDIEPVLTARIRRHAGASQVLHTFATSLVELVLPNIYGDAPVIAAQLDQIGPTTTEAWTWDVGEWDLLVDHEVAVRGPVAAPWAVSR